MQIITDNGVYVLDNSTLQIIGNLLVINSTDWKFHLVPSEPEEEVDDEA
jgi:hypothetical protein